MIEKLIQLANDLDSKGYQKQADYIDGVITQVHGKGPGKADSESAFDLFIDNKGRAVGAQPSQGDVGSTCVMNDSASETDSGLGDFSDLDETNITEDEAFSAGCTVCGDKEHSCGHKESSYMIKPQLYKIHEYAKKLHDMVDDNHPLPDWAESHVAKMDQMIESVYHSYDYKQNVKGE